MGGVVAAWWVAAMEIALFEEHHGKAVVRLAERVFWRALPLNFMTAAPMDEPEMSEGVAGVTHNVSFTASLRADRIGLGDAAFLSIAAEKYGVVIKAQYVDGRVVVIGNTAEPLYGYLKNVPGQAPKDSNPLLLSVSGVCRFGPLLLGS